MVGFSFFLPPPPALRLSKLRLSCVGFCRHPHLHVILTKVLAPVRCSSFLVLEEHLIMTGFPLERILHSVP